jgi:hypothetical protein
VLIPNGRYKGQKLTRLVITNITASAIRITPRTPGITPVKYSKAITIAIRTLIILSVEPIFFFMMMTPVSKLIIK